MYRFHDTLLLTYQQMGSMLTGLLDPGMVHTNIQAAIDHHDRLGNVIANDVISPFGATKILNPEHSRRAVTLISSDGAGTAFDLIRTISAAELLSKAGAPTGAGQRIMLYSPGQLRDILAITQASSSDFTKNQIHDRGTIDGVSWEGFTWMEIADVIGTDGSTALGRMLGLSSTTRSCIAFHRGCVGLSKGRDISTKINERADLNNCIQVRSFMSQAAVRVWEGGVVQVDALEN
jgi:hypothetical protein